MKLSLNVLKKMMTLSLACFLAVPAFDVLNAEENTEIPEITEETPKEAIAEEAALDEEKTSSEVETADGFDPGDASINGMISDNATPIQLDVNTTVNITDVYRTKYFSFVPLETALYNFSSSSVNNDDTIGYLYDASENEIASDDDGAGNMQFSISYTLNAGTQYYFAAKYYSTTKTGSFTVTLTKQTDDEDQPEVPPHWEEDSTGKRYVMSDGNYATLRFVNIGGSVYYFDGRGYMVSGWQLISNQWYHFASSGTMNTGWLLDGKTWYYLNSNGVMQTGWKLINSVWYYFFGSGAMATGWQKVNNVWYYMNQSGAMQTGWQKVNNVWYYMNQSGAMQTGWQTIGNARYYLGSNGAMRTGWQLLWDSYYEVNHWYYFWPGGSQATGWVKVNNKWYYLNDYMYYYGYYYINGTKYWFKPNGEMIDGWYYYDGSTKMDGEEGFTGWVCCNSNGTGRNGWIPYGDDWYYGDEGDLYIGFYYIGGVFYAFNLDGKMYKDRFLYPYTFDQDYFDASYPYHVDADGRGSNGWVRYNSTTEYYYVNGESHLRRISG